MSRMRLTAVDSRVVLEYTNDADERITREFTCPMDGGYVRERNAHGEWKQVCDGLVSRGSTLRSSSLEGLVEVIRREYRSACRKAQAQAKRDERRFGA